MFKKLSFRISFALIVILGSIVTVFTIYLVNDRSEQLRSTILKKGIATTQTGAKIMSDILENVVENDIFSLDELFNDSLVKIPFDNAVLAKYKDISEEQLNAIQKYHYASKLDVYLDTLISNIQNEFFKDPQVVFAVLCDKQGYTPTHNAKYNKSLTGNFTIDNEESRAKRIYYDSIPIENYKNHEYILKVYNRDTGEEMWRISSPVYVKDRLWGSFRIGFSMRKTEKAISNLQKRLIIMMLILLLITVVAINRTTAFLMRPLKKLYQGVTKVAQGDLSYSIELRRTDEIGDLARAFNKMTKDLNEYIVNLKTTTASKERIQSELQLGKDIQKRMLPHVFPAFPNRKDIDIFAVMEPAKEVAGDFYDFFFIDKDNLCIIISDVSGKGVPSALFMVIAKTLVQTEAQRQIKIEDVLFNVNNSLSANNETAMFATMFCGIINTKTGVLTMVNAGHNPPIYGNTDTRFQFMELDQNIALGVIDDFTFNSNKFQMKKGDRIILYTDGITEAFNSKGELFSEKRLIDVVTKNKDLSNMQLVKNIQNEINAFAEDEAQSDDITILSVTFNGN